ncbi:MAG: DNA ligase D [Sphingobacterium sp.]
MEKLKAYQKKRNFSSSNEPKGKITNPKKGALKFVVQRHHASRLHYDFRIELQGVLKSWAIPKGPSMNPKDKRLAVQVEDHPVGYGSFEGNIPKGNYGAGTVSIFDEGTYKFIQQKTEADFAKALQDGSIKIELDGRVLKGEFALVRMKGAESDSWLLIKHNDQYATHKPFDAEDLVESSIKKAGVDFKKSNKAKTLKSDPSSVRKTNDSWTPSPMYARLKDTIPEEEDWQFERKFDGFRIIILKQGKQVKLVSRNGKSMNQKFPSLLKVWKENEKDFCIDGELVIEDKDGKSHFQMLQKGEPLGKGMVLKYYPFDLLMLDNERLHHFALTDRQQLLEMFLTKTSSPVLGESTVLTEKTDKLLGTAQQKGWEGVIGKRRDSKYHEGKRTGDWVKIKIRQSQEAVICGYTKPKGSRRGFGALILGVYQNKELRYIGNCGTGFDDKLLIELHKKLQTLSRKTKPFSKNTVVANEVSAHWVTPKLVCEVYYTEWTIEGHMRHPVFKGLRTDKIAGEVKIENSRKMEKEREMHFGTKKVMLTNLDKVYWPKEGITKGALISYYEQMGPHMLPYLKDKPISMHRFPNGIEKPSFFQKDVDPEKIPKWIKTAPVFSESTDKEIDYIVCNNLPTLLYLANLGSIEINPWLATYRKVESPDFAVLDLDPNGAPFDRLLNVARTLREVLESTNINGFIKTSGSTGLHVYFYLARRYEFDLARNFIELLAEILHERHPEETSLIRDPKKRKGKIYLDFLQNRRGQTIASPYSVRPKPLATVSAPLHWEELDDNLEIQNFTIHNMIARVEKMDPWSAIWESKLNLKDALSRF